MGVVIRQSIWNSVVSYIGIVIGAVNTLFLFTNFLTAEEFGLTRVLLVMATLANQIFSLGIVNVTLKFFPFVKSDALKHNGFLSFILTVPLVGYFLFVLLALLFDRPIIDFYTDNSTLFGDYYSQVFVLTFLIIYFNVFDGYLRSNKKSVFPVFLKNVFLRLLWTVGIVLFYLKWIDFETFVLWYVWSHGLVLLMEVIYTQLIGQLHFKRFDISAFPRNEMMSFGGYAILGASMSYMANYLDVLMVGGITENGLADAAIYSVAVYIGSLITVPYNSVIRIGTSFIADAWKKNDLAQIQELYKRSSSNLLFFGVLIFLGIWLNIDNIFKILPEKYEGGKYVVLLVGLAKLVDASTSLNGIIMQYSKYFKTLLMFNGAFVVLIVISNWIFIPIYGLEGAAMATLISLLSTNLLKSWFLYAKFKLVPFDKRVVWIAMLGIGLWIANIFTPNLDNHILDSIIRSILITLIYLTIAYKMKLSDELNRIVQKRLLKSKS